ncbi:MAG: DUF305 domain-containing protein [Patescibacteria group bacterium]
MKNQNIIYGIVGICIGLIAMGLWTGRGDERRGDDDGYARNGQATHRMSDGTMMNNVGMGMDSMMRGMTASLEGKTGDAFDKEFLAQMIVHHEGAVVMAKQVLATSKRPELIKLANDIIAAQTKEIEMMKGWQSQWFK